MQTKVNRDELVKKKGVLPLPQDLEKYEINQELSDRVQKHMLEVVGQKVTEDPQRGPFFDGKEEKCAR